VRRRDATRTVAYVVACVVLGSVSARADDAELQELKATVNQMEQTIQDLKAKIDRLEKQRGAPPLPAAAAPTPSVAVAAEPSPEPEPQIAMPPPADQEAAGWAERVLSSQGMGPQTPIDPKWRGFFPVPFTRAMIRFNAKPRVDFTLDNNNAGDDNRFIPGKIPVAGNPVQGGGEVFNVNGKGSQLIVDFRAPTITGAPRFYYQNDFFGSGGGEFDLRVQFLYGRIYGLSIGQTFSPFEDPDIWPDTVDYEGPNSMIFARFPLARYRFPLSDHWEVNAGLTQPESVPASYNGQTVVGVNHMPDFAFNARYASADFGHFQASTVFRDIGARTLAFGNHEAFGFGLNLGGSLNVFAADLMQGQLTYGQGLGRYGNDTGFFPTDAAFNSNGSLIALPYYGAFFGYTHRWFDDWRSTATYGFVDLDNQPSQGLDAYHQTQYASNRKSGDVFRTQVGVAYSLF